MSDKPGSRWHCDWITNFSCKFLFNDLERDLPNLIACLILKVAAIFLSIYLIITNNYEHATHTRCITLHWLYRFSCNSAMIPSPTAEYAGNFMYRNAIIYIVINYNSSVQWYKCLLKYCYFTLNNISLAYIYY